MGSPQERDEPPAREPIDDEPALPRSTVDDTDAGWGEPRADQEEWLRAQRPPHWE